MARKPRVAERDILKAVLAALNGDKRVAWAERMNSGAYKVGARYVRFGFPGCSDVLGQMQDGRLLAIEVKAADGVVSADQSDFLALVHNNGGVAGVARSADDALQIVRGQ